MGYLGSVAISGAIDLRTAIDRLSQLGWEDGFAFLAYGVGTVYPEFRPEGVFTSKGLSRYRAVNQACSAPLQEPPTALGDMLKIGWQDNPFVRNFLDRNTLGLRRAHAPLLVISAEDPKATDSMAARVVARMCGQGDRIDFERYPDVDPSGLMGASVAAQISWVKARFAGQEAPNNCP